MRGGASEGRLPPAAGTGGFFDDLAVIWRQSRHPIFNGAGQQVGSYDTLDAACQGVWYPFTGIAKPPPSQLYVVDFWGRRVPISTQCVKAAQATAKPGPSLTYPQPVQPSSAVKAADAAGNIDALTDTLDRSLADYAALRDDFGAPGGNQQLVTYAAFGVLALVGVALLMPSERRR